MCSQRRHTRAKVQFQPLGYLTLSPLTFDGPLPPSSPPHPPLRPRMCVTPQLLLKSISGGVSSTGVGSADIPPKKNISRVQMSKRWRDTNQYAKEREREGVHEGWLRLRRKRGRRVSRSKLSDVVTRVCVSPTV